MRGPLIVLFSGLILAGAIVAGCGGGGGGGGAPFVPGHATQSNTMVNVSLVIPEKTSQGKRVPKYVSPSTQSALVEIIGPIPSPSPSATPSIGPNLVVATGFANLNSQNCTTTSAGETCNLSIPANLTQAGAYGIAVITSDQPQTSACTFVTPGTAAPSPTPVPSGTCVGHALGINIAEVNITPGSTTSVPISLGGVPAFFQPVELVSGMVGGHNNSLQVFGSGQATVSFQLLDADKNIIVGPNPLQLTVINPATNLANVSVTQTPDPTGLYTMTITPQVTSVSGQNLVSTGTTQLSILSAITSNFNSLASPAPVTLGTFQFGLQMMHSEVAVQNNSGQVLLYLDGNTSSPTYTVYGSGAVQLGLAFDSASNLWVADPNNGDLVEFGASANGVTPTETTVYCGLGGGSGNCTGSTGSVDFSPSFIDIDAQDNLYASYWNGSTYLFSQWTSTAAGTVPSPLNAPAWTVNGTASNYFCHVVADNNGNIYVGTNFGGTYALLKYPISSQTSTNISAANINGAAFAPDGSVWYIAYAAGLSNVWSYDPTTATSTMPGVTGVAGATTQGLAIDMLGNVYIADGTNPGVKEYTKSSNYASSTLVGLALSPAGVAVFPNGLYGANHQVGLAQPTQSPIPIASPVIL